MEGSKLKLQDSVGYLIVNTGRKLTLNLTQLFQTHNLTSEQWSLLMSLHNEEGISQKELAERTEKDPANVTRILDQLERKGLVRRVTNPEDRRSFNMFVTESGREAALELMPVEAQFVQEILVDIPQAEIEAFKAFMLKVNRNIERRRVAAE
ncbi:MarR family winged helix-turn-helix transcriptional regulator [Paenibacillus aestuarii]|uniref:MarR family winged helix-turn-helix transcriptional regulator n=1 Tax=Paenibacillus aestuarii TaxID=516965 RepID=A0ABW0KDN9_9BACL|nr:MarR family transcriptional regulator [Paenibacillus aestuarii]